MKEFYEDIIEKKRIARGIHNRASRLKGFKGAVKFPSDYLKGKEKKEYCGNGKVETYMLIPEYSDFKAMDDDNKTRVLASLIKKYDRKEIAEKWGLAKGSIDAMVHLHKLSKPRKEKKESVEPAAKKVRSAAINNLAVEIKGNVDEIKTRLLELMKLVDQNKLHDVYFTVRCSND